MSYTDSVRVSSNIVLIFSFSLVNVLNFVSSKSFCSTSKCKPFSSSLSLKIYNYNPLPLLSLPIHMLLMVTLQFIFQ